MNDGVVDLLVIGAGISGLGMARMAKSLGVGPLVVEAGSHIGGAIDSHRFRTERGSYWAELGGHTCYNSYGNLLQLLQESGQLDRLVAKRKLRYSMQIGNRLTSIPSQLKFIELLGVLPRLWRSKKEGRSVREYFGGIIGRQNFQRVLGPALDAVVCQPAAEFPADALFRKKPRRKEIMRSYTGAEGLQSFVDGIASGLQIRTQSPVTGVERNGAHYQVRLQGGETIEASRLALAVAPDVAAKLLAAPLPEVAARIAEIEMADIISQAVLLRSDQVSTPLLAGIIGRDDDFYSVVSRDPVADEHYRAFTFHFRPDRRDEAARLARICQVLGVSEGDILASVTRQNRLPALRLGHAERVGRIDRALRGHSLAITGNWFSGVSIEDSLVRTHDECQRLLGGD
ncbi:MAG: FAD-dependent oxidoreductase [Candidatus Thiodiazotropha sp. (ex Dulcina madagascariensis)]|nr:FAD-dependent oxidoreductase [Candidatus Thiodiazotropha sp. (ex Dulcina madagascariensis)]